MPVPTTKHLLAAALLALLAAAPMARAQFASDSPPNPMTSPTDASYTAVGVSAGLNGDRAAPPSSGVDFP
jgi:hypothetical protein